MTGLAEAGGTGGGVGGLNAIYYRTVRDGIVWCNNSVPTANALGIEELTKAENERRETALITLEFFRKHLPGFEDAYPHPNGVARPLLSGRDGPATSQSPEGLRCGPQHTIGPHFAQIIRPVGLTEVNTGVSIVYTNKARGGFTTTP